MTKDNFIIVGGISFLALALTVSISTQDAFSFGLIDQETSPFFDFTGTSGVSSNFLKGQVFVPNADNLIAVDVGLNDPPLGPVWDIGDTLNFTIHQDTDSFNVPGIEFDTTGTLTSIDGSTRHFELDFPVTLISGQPHILEIVWDDPNSLTWLGSSVGTYSDGNGVFCNIELNICGSLGPNWDHSFRTYFSPSESGKNMIPEKVLICHVDQETGEKSTMNVTLKSAEIHLENHSEDEEGECPQPLSCSGQFDAAQEFLDQCYADGYTTTQCGPPLWQFVINYALECEGTEEEKMAACQVAKDSYLSLCGIVGPSDQCTEEAETLYNGCVDGSITTDPGPFD